jgi:CPA2 family monovalent cation:H+ antiporter-2
MFADPIFFRDLAYVFAAAVIGGGLAWLARQPLILGYVVGGILISPLTPGPAVTDMRTFEAFAEIGVILLMFSLGIEFSVRDLLRVKWIALIGGPVGIVLTVLLTLAVGGALGWSYLQSTVVGLVVSVASTMVLARLLMDRGELNSRHGRIMIGTALVEDLAVVGLIVVMPRLGAVDGDRVLAIVIALVGAAALLGPFTYLAAKVVPTLLTRVARTRSPELFLLVSLAVALGTAAVTQAAGLSLALGAFLAGLVISGSDYAHETLARLLSLRDVFVALFFVTMGALLNPAALAGSLSLLGVLVGLVVVGKLVIRTLLVRFFGESLWTALLVGVGLTQIGEFSFVLIQVARSAGHVGEDVYHATLGASLLTILINAALVRWVPTWVGKARLAHAAAGAGAPPPADGDRGHVVVCGFGRVGSAVAEALQTFDTPYVAIELDPDIVKNLRGRGVPAIYGDAAEPRILQAAWAERAVLAVVAVPDMQRAERTVRHLRDLNPKLPIFARAHTAAARNRLVAAGATEVIQPELEAASTLIRHSLRQLALPRDRVLAYLERFRGAMDTATSAGGGAEGSLPDVREVTVEVESLADLSLREARVRERFGVTVLAITRADGEVILHPSPDTVFRPGDRVRVFGLPAQMAAFMQESQGASERR